jgi:hypothetical protein
MDCKSIEHRLSEYMESSLPAEEMSRVSKHLENFPACSALSVEIGKIFSLCNSYPALELNLEVVDRILLRTSGRPRTRSLLERLYHLLKQTLLTPRIAVGAGLAVVFVAITYNLLLPSLSGLSPNQLTNFMDRGVRQVYGEALRLYETKNEWQARIAFFKSTTLNKLRSIVDRMEAPVESPRETKEVPPKDKRSGLNEQWFVVENRIGWERRRLAGSFAADFVGQRRKPGLPEMGVWL